MKLLAIDASTMVATVALATDSGIVAEYTVNNKKTHSQTLLPMIDVIIKNVGWDVKELDYIAVTNGPGSFTGLRIGAATAKGLAQALNIPIVAISSLEALAMNVVETNKLICPIMDARRGNVFSAIYQSKNNKLEIVMEQQAISVEKLLKELNKNEKEVIFVGDGIRVHDEYIKQELQLNYSYAPVVIREQRAASIAQCAFGYIEKDNVVSSAEFELEYLRKSQAEREMEQKINRLENK